MFKASGCTDHFYNYGDTNYYNRTFEDYFENWVDDEHFQSLMQQEVNIVGNFYR